MGNLRRLVAPRSYGSNATYVYEYSRGLNGVDVPKDVIFTRIIVVSILAVAFIVFCGRIAQISHSTLRHVTSLGSSRKQQTYWSVEESSLWTNIKKHVLYAPLGRKRHNREIQLSSAVNIGTLPSRFQMIMIILYIACQFAYCLLLDYKANVKEALVAELRGRSGTLAVLNMVPLFLLAGRNNPLIPLLRLSFDTYNLLHRWLGRLVVLESLVHVAAWAVNACREQDFSDMLWRIRTVPFFSWGFLGTCSFVCLGLHSPSPIRHAFYETFLHLHQLFAFLAVVGVYAHLHIDNLPQKPWLIAIIVIWLFDRCCRMGRLIYLNFSLKKGSTKLVVEALPGEACRVTFHLPKRVHINPGSHVYAYIPSISKWMSHPFSVAWVDPSTCVTPTTATETFTRSNDNNNPTSSTSTIDVDPSLLEKQAIVNLDEYLDTTNKPASVSLIISARQGMTRKLYNTASAAPNNTLYTSGFIEGPYAAHPINMASYGTAVLFSAGAGITHHLLFVRDLLIRAAEGRVATHRIYLIWSVRSTDHLTWVQSYMDQILRLPGRRDILVIKLFVSKPKSTREIVSPSATVQMFPGRCRPDVVLDEVLPTRVGATAVSVCGPGAFADEVRAATRERIGVGAVVDLAEEAFTW
ncbi:ferric reductase family protein [Aspergillus ruber CBS 135680]|uniref:Metalloreductase n=1 Tax=Aspergillus ruber (strain CBS 135680) TaxID=1388766 RepID=A0A017SS51_ASPRC|nr:metalloreductase [Aspergillus ruber CBS 135680]EYE99075.1 metalloreductase [Aspergillus ruber CBS 135680]